LSEAPPQIVRFLESAAARGEGRVVGATAIARSELAWTAIAGGADESLFQAGSLSKTVTAAVALELVARGELDLDGELATTAGRTTLRDLLGHTAGMNVPFYAGYVQDGEAPTLAESLGGIEPASTPAVEPDPKFAGRFRYSGGGFALVQQLLEDVAGSPFAEVARDVVLGPVGMSRSTFVQPPPPPLLAAAAQAEWRLYPESAAAGLWTTPADLARFVCALQTRRTLRPETVEAMTTPHAKLPSGGLWRFAALLGLERPRSAGLGLFLGDERFINLGGAARSFSALLGSSRDGTGAVVMTTGCRPPLALRILFELGDAEGWSGVHARRRSSALLLRALS
jgi:CubicO group peptidase (beta-lactamase class C family)